MPDTNTTRDAVERLRADRAKEDSNPRGCRQMGDPYPCMAGCPCALRNLAIEQFDRAETAESDKDAAVAAAYERAAIEVNARGDRARVLALATPDQLAALEAVKAEAREEGRLEILNQPWLDQEDDMTAGIRADSNSAGYFERYQKAQELVSNRYSKGGLVALVCYLLSRRALIGETDHE